MANTKNRFPLVFTFSDHLLTPSGPVVVGVSGRGLLVEEGPEDFALYGVNPGGLVGVGAEKWEAYTNFRETFREILFDIAVSCGGFEEFQAEVSRFVHEASDQALRDWEAAVAEVRAGQIQADWIGRASADKPPGVRVSLLPTQPAKKPVPPKQAAQNALAGQNLLADHNALDAQNMLDVNQSDTKALAA